ncbi:RHS repeat-associated core domain-containing protein [Leptospira interrogans]|nr:RHS repeat-associated core domain-containing protein [Leptospira interrogans]
MGANVSPGVPSIQNPGVGMTGGGSVDGMPVTGMYFYHPNYLGSITMITDGAGNPASGPEPGVSYVSYEPYGSIIRNDSYSPDIFRYKFTSQIEDKETGLYYYKARYYEPTLGRFLQADSVVMPTNVNGMNRYMYVDGNPVSYRDPSGHISGPDMMHMLNRIVGHAMGKDFHNGNSPSIKSIGKDLSKSILGKSLSKGFYKNIKKFQNWSQKAFFLRSLKSRVNKLVRKEQITIIGCRVIGKAVGFNDESISTCQTIARENFEDEMDKLYREYYGDPDYTPDENLVKFYATVYIIDCALPGEEGLSSASQFCEGTDQGREN